MPNDGCMIIVHTKKTFSRGESFFIAKWIVFSTYTLLFLFKRDMKLTEFKQQFDRVLQTHLSNKLKETQPYIFTNDLEQIYAFLLQYAQWGKRIRPYLVYLFYKIHGWVDDNLAIQTWIINELIHIFALIHDDITDEWTKRHNLPSYHYFAKDYLQNNENQGKNIALLIWDLVLSRAYEQLWKLNLSVQTQQYFHTMMHQTVCGQIMDVYLSHTETLHSKEIITTKDHAKSWRYTFKKPILIWNALSWKKTNTHRSEFWELLWVTYQMRDDLLDIIDGHGDKTPFSDHQEGNQTFLLAHLLDQCTQEQKQFIINTRWRQCNTDTDTDTQKTLLSMYETTDTINRAKHTINANLASCKEIINQIMEDNKELKKEYIIYLLDIISLLELPTP